jgi:hypothetical protein
LTSALGGGEWSALRPGRFTPRERAPGTRWIGWVGPTAVLDAVVKGKIPSHRRESNSRTPIVQPVVFPYKMYILHKFSHHEKGRRLQFAAWAQEENVTLLNKWFSDEVHFYLDLTVNKQNVRFLATEHPRNLQEVAMSSQRSVFDLKKLLDKMEVILNMCYHDTTFQGLKK